MTSLPQPERFWEVRVHDVSPNQGLSGLCVGYEQGQWRYSAFADYIMEWLPEFCLNSKERTDLSHATAVKSLRKAANLVYQTEKYGKRGEFGELFLHAAIRSVFDSLPAISKIFYKSAHNDTVKGFDCVHVVGPLDDLELWLGEVKFYTDVAAAMSDVITELRQHLTPDFLRNEFILIGNKLDDIRNLPTGDYSFFAKQVESLFRAEICAALDEYGIPSSVAEKCPFLSQANDLDTALQALLRQDLSRLSLHPYEIELLAAARDSLQPIA